jgi:hypothetical protein
LFPGWIIAGLQHRDICAIGRSASSVAAIPQHIRNDKCLRAVFMKIPRSQVCCKGDYDAIRLISEDYCLQEGVDKYRSVTLSAYTILFAQPLKSYVIERFTREDVGSR